MGEADDGKLTYRIERNQMPTGANMNHGGVT